LQHIFVFEALNYGDSNYYTEICESFFKEKRKENKRASMETKRQQKFGRQIQKDLSDIFQKEFKMIFGNGMVTVTDVKMSPDLSVARCYLSFLLIDDREAVMNQIDLENKAIRNALANRIRKQVRIIPNLVFFLDDTAAYAAKIEALFEGLVIPPAEGEVLNRVTDEID
jgi:ribosome-binding factor A